MKEGVKAILEFVFCGSFGSTTPKERTNEPAPQWPSKYGPALYSFMEETE